MATFGLGVEEADRLARESPDLIEAMEWYCLLRRDERADELRVMIEAGAARL